MPTPAVWLPSGPLVGTEVVPLKLKRIKGRTTRGIFAYKCRQGRRYGVESRDPATRKRVRRLGFSSRSLAVQWKEQKDRELLGLVPKQSTITLREATARYIEHRRAEGKSLRSYTHLVIVSKRSEEPGFWVKELGERRLSAITSDDVDNVLRNGMKRRQWASATYNRALSQLSGMLSYAVQSGWLNEHPLKHGRVPRLPEDNARTRWLRLHELEAILDHSPAWLADTIRFAVATGMRLGEVCNLTRASYQMDEHGRAYLITERTKNGERLVWPLEGWPVDHVKARVEATKFPGDRIFPGPRGGNPYTCIHSTLPRVVEAAGLRYGRKHADGVTFHVFRHTMASLALNHGVPESTVQRMGNWKSRTMVARYAHLADETLRKGAATVARVIFHPSKRSG